MPPARNAWPIASNAPVRARAGFVRVNGLFVMALLVALGFGAGAAYYSYKEPRVRAAIEREVAAAPTSAEARLDHWLRFGAAQVHHRLSVVARVSQELPWLVTHTVEVEDGGPPEVYGIDVSSLPKDLARREGMTVVVHLPRPVLLGRAELAGDNARHVPRYAHGSAVADPSARLAELADWFLADLARALERDIEGAALLVRVEDGPAAAGETEPGRAGE